ncbi:hypothetical protein B1812_17535 [Methylocystis bryophila]|uniref:Uncharacterized protein n=1 Tax=Methylocystis bryophila TaxID=655015 RepID=A0A1W6MYC5_9HYPH|nr:hypothetical protein B1812_17535 [Methylocystis bryophila]
MSIERNCSRIKKIAGSICEFPSQKPTDFCAKFALPLQASHPPTPPGADEALERVPIAWNHATERTKLQIKN